MPTIPTISAAEWKVMKLLWKKSPQGAYDVIEAIKSTEDWHPNTVKTLLKRLYKKKAVRIEKYKNLFLYSPLISEAECVQAETESFVDRVFGGSVKPLLAHFVQHQKLTKEELAELRKLLRGSGK